MRLLWYLIVRPFPGKFEIEMECVAPKENMVLLDENDVQIPLQYIQLKASCKGRSCMNSVANLPSFCRYNFLPGNK